jgi:hypothetical protein
MAEKGYSTLRSFPRIGPIRTDSLRIWCFARSVVLIIASLVNDALGRGTLRMLERLCERLDFDDVMPRARACRRHPAIARSISLKIAFARATVIRVRSTARHDRDRRPTSWDIHVLSSRTRSGVDRP